MEKDTIFQPRPPLTTMGMEIQVGDLNCSSEQLLPNWFLNLNWENSMDQSVPFESTLSSIVSSPLASSSPNAVSVPPSDSVVIKELIGKLGLICNSGEISQTLVGNGGGSSYTTTPLNSPPKLNLSMMNHQHHHQIMENLPISNQPNLAPLPADPGFVERAAKFSCFGLTSQFGLNASELLPHRSTSTTPNLSRVSSSQSLKATEMGIQENKEVPQLQDGLEKGKRSDSQRKFSATLSRSFTPENSREESSVTEQIPNSRKRKTPNPRGKSKDLTSSPPSKDTAQIAEDDNSNPKRCKSVEDGENVENNSKAKVESNGAHNQTKEKPKLPEPPKDYIHVRARRGQATDSHSLAERVRREKISERMKFLQDLVPGCNKVTGKAVMLDEIINYVQALQHQVEFLSMKLATVNPRLDFNVETLLSKDIFQSHRPLPHLVSPIDSSASALPYGHQPHQGLTQQSGISNVTDTQCSVNPLEAALHQSSSMQLPPSHGFGEAPSQPAIFWGDDLQSVVQMGFGQHQSLETAFQSQSFHGTPPTAHMKMEL